MATSERALAPRANSVWVSAAVTVLLLVLTDLALGLWHAWPQRLPEHFSSAYLERYATNPGPGENLVVLGDSELWGYGVATADSPVAQLARALPGAHVTNLAFEAQTPVNADFVLRYLLSRGVRPRAVVLELNAAAFNQTAAAYDTLNANLAELALPNLVEPFDRDKLDPAQLRPPTTADRLDRFVAAHWLLYASRVDLHQALFGDADLASALQRRVSPLLQGTRARAPVYAATYDLTPLDATNVSFAYADHALALLEGLHVPALVVLPPTNHALLHAYIDNPAYTANLMRLTRLAAAHHAAVLDCDRLLGRADFIDNTHVNPLGAGRFAQALSRPVARLLDVL
ncbi:MAG TPA: hypothetical protein VHT05_07365 [Candidatus Elarobacter sp.]|jgi:lysophospholipase L1-like esterase|nr:hypothetical protein [Candidatus Elarobacter sp.]